MSVKFTDNSFAFSTDHEKEGFSGEHGEYTEPNPVYKDLDGDEFDTNQPETRRGDSSDEIDPRKLVRTPSLSELRWYYNRTFAKVIVNKPVDDAFKHGIDILGQNSSEIENVFDDIEYIENYRMAEKKARRDGFALVFFGWETAGNQPDTSKIPNNVTGVSHTKVLTVDDLTDAAKSRIADDVPLDMDDFVVRDSGIVVNKKLADEGFNEPIGYVLNTHDPQFIHKDWIQHLVWNPEVDGDYETDAIDSNIQNYKEQLGRWEGESVLTSCYDLLKWLKKANWSIGQTLFRYASKMYSVKLPNDATEDEFEDARKALRNLNSKSEIILPSVDYEVDDYDTDGQLEPEEYFDIFFEQICACTEMTKSVLFGTQQGTVTGSETDIKNYFNQVERMRQNRITDKMREAVEMLTNVNTASGSQVISNFASGEFDVKWSPLFKMSEEDRVEAIRTSANAVTMLINNYALTPNEARSILSEEWAEFEGLEELEEEDYDVFDRINLNTVGAYKGGEKAEEELGGGEAGVHPSVMQNPREQNGGGRQQGENSESTNPNTQDSNGMSFTTLTEGGSE